MGSLVHPRAVRGEESRPLRPPVGRTVIRGGGLAPPPRFPRAALLQRPLLPGDNFPSWGPSRGLCTPRGAGGGGRRQFLQISFARGHVPCRAQSCRLCSIHIFGELLFPLNPSAPPPQTSPGLGPFPLFGAGMGKELRSPERSTVKFCFPNQDRWGRLDDKTTALQHLTHSAVPLTQQQPPPQKCVSPPRSRNLLPPPPPPRTPRAGHPQVSAATYGLMPDIFWR